MNWRRTNRIPLDREPVPAQAGYNQTIGRVRWTICAMLFAATSINYMDRQVLGILKPTLQQSIGLSELHYSYVIAAFQAAYAIGLLIAGRVVDKLGSRIGYAIIMGVWSAAAIGHAFVNSALGFGVARFFLGLGEAGNFPAAIKTTTEWFPQTERSFATGIFNSGANVGAVLAPAIIPWIALRFGWRAGFLVTGLFSLSWIVWWITHYRRPSEHRTLSGPELMYIIGEAHEQQGGTVSWQRLFGFRQTWGFLLAKLLTDPIWWFYLYWLPSYFGERFHLNLSHLGLPLILVYNFSTVGSIGGGYLPILYARFGVQPTYTRVAAMLTCALLAVPMIFASRLHSEWVAIALLSLAAGAHQGWSANLFTTASDMFPRSAVGAVVGIGGMAGSVGGILFSLYVGRILELTHSYAVLFGIAGSVYLLALVILNLLAPGLRKVVLPQTHQAVSLEQST